MSWAIGINKGRWIGYGVPAICDQIECGSEIDRGLSYLCGDGEEGCGLFFCNKHLYMTTNLYELCERCADSKPPFEPTADTSKWNTHILADLTWENWRKENPDKVLSLQKIRSVM